MAPPIEMFWFLLDPWLFMAQSLSHLPPTILHLLRTHNLTTLLHPSALQSAWFGTFWSSAGPSVRDTSIVRVAPLLEGSIVNGRVVDAVNPVGAKEKGNGGEPVREEEGGEAEEYRGIAGTILEIGPGTGMWLPLLSKLLHSFPGGSSSRRITHIYGVEPNPDVHDALRNSVGAAGLTDTYEIVPLGVEDLAASGRVARGSVDCVVSVLCLCGIPDPAFHIREIYGYLRPGGKWFVYEHVRCGSERTRECGLFMRVYQRFLNLFWPHFLGGCQLRRNTPKMLREAGPWTKIDLAQPEDEPWYHPLPHIIGTLTK